MTPLEVCRTNAEALLKHCSQFNRLTFLLAAEVMLDQAEARPGLTDADLAIHNAHGALEVALALFTRGMA